MLKTMLVPLDGTEMSERVMRESIDLAKRIGASIVGFTAEPELPSPTEDSSTISYQRELDAHRQRSEGHAKEVLSRFAAQAAEAGVDFSSRHAVSNQVEDEIVRIAEELEEPLIVMFTHGRGLFGELLYGSHTKNVMGKTKVPLLVLH